MGRGMIGHAEWVEHMRPVSVLDVAQAFGFPTSPARGSSGGRVHTCPACGSQGNPRGGARYAGNQDVGLRKEGGWHCFACQASGDTIHFVAYALCGKRFGELGESDKSKVRAWCCSFLGLAGAGSNLHRARTAGPAVPEQRPEAPTTTYPPGDQLQALWRGTIRPDRDPQVAAFLRSRAIDSTTLADREFVRALHAGSPEFAWARFGQHSWCSSGYRLITLLYDARGVARSCIARGIGSQDPKSVSPRGHMRAGLVLADELGKRVLRHGTHTSKWPHEAQQGVPFDAPQDHPWWPADEPLRIVICEGEVDWISWATEQSDATTHPRAVLGIVQGAWTQAIADRMPDGALVTVATDLDESGDKYLASIVDTFRGRDLTVRRWRPAVQALPGSAA